MAHVLLVDDEPSLRFVLRIAFESAGHQVAEAGNGAAALDSIAAARPDLVTTDFMMPVMNGRELISRLRSDPATATMPVLLVSSSIGAAGVKGADRFIQKPFDPMEVVAEAAELLGRVGA